jgi:phosphomannomutase
MAYVLAQGEYPLSVVFTASHNPPEDVGMKFFDTQTSFLSQQFLKDLFVRYESIAPEFVSEFAPVLPEANERRLASGLQEKKELLFDRLDAVFDQLFLPHSFCVDFSTGACTSLEYQYLCRLQKK